MESFSKTVFIEYSSAKEGQHLITVVQKVDHERVIIGRIYRDFDPQTKKASYRAYDFQGNQIFFDVHNLYELKSKFKEHGNSLADNAFSARRATRNQNQKIPTYPVHSRLNGIRTVRGEKSDKEKNQGKETKEGSNRRELAQMEKEQDERNETHYQDLGTVIDREEPPEISQEIETDTEEIDTDNDPDLEEESYGDDISDREMELEEIRDNNDDREQDHDLDR